MGHRIRRVSKTNQPSLPTRLLLLLLLLLCGRLVLSEARFVSSRRNKRETASLGTCWDGRHPSAVSPLRAAVANWVVMQEITGQAGPSWFSRARGFFPSALPRCFCFFFGGGGGVGGGIDPEHKLHMMVLAVCLTC